METEAQKAMSDVLSDYHTAAEAMALLKENAIKQALNDFFGDNWSEEGIKQTELVQFIVTPEGEYLELAGERRIFFGNIEQDVQFDGKSVICRYKQEIRRLY